MLVFRGVYKSKKVVDIEQIHFAMSGRHAVFLEKIMLNSLVKRKYRELKHPAFVAVLPREIRDFHGYELQALTISLSHERYQKVVRNMSTLHG